MAMGQFPWFFLRPSPRLFANRPRKVAGKTKHIRAQTSRTVEIGEASASDGVLCSRKPAGMRLAEHTRNWKCARKQEGPDSESEIKSLEEVFKDPDLKFCTLSPRNRGLRFGGCTATLHSIHQTLHIKPWFC